MESVIEFGDYIRTRLGTIGKVILKFKSYCVISNTHGEIDVPYENIKGFSKEIIALIEVDDFVNGYRVEDVGRTFVNVATGSNYFQDPIIFDIKSIVTKEQFSNMEYIV